MSQEFLVVHNLGQLTGITIEPAGRVHPHEIECWELNDGKKVIFAKMQLGRLLKDFHVGGAYAAMAKYGLSYYEVIQILRSKIGPHDRMRYMLATRSIAERSEVPEIASTLLMGIGTTAAKVLVMMAKFLGVALLFPFVIMFFNRHRDKR